MIEGDKTCKTSQYGVSVHTVVNSNSLGKIFRAQMVFKDVKNQAISTVSQMKPDNVNNSIIFVSSKAWAQIKISIRLTQLAARHDFVIFCPLC